jgi:membrane protease YdiL (CAAX protease family)
MDANKITLKTFALSIFTVLILESVFRLTISGQSASLLLQLGILRMIEAFLLVFIARQLEKDPGAIGLSRSTLLPGIVRGLIWAACFGVAAGALFLVLFAAGVDALKLLGNPATSTRQHAIVFFLVGGVIGPVTEEIFFRGIVYGFFRQWGVFVAVVFSTLLFVFIHPVGANLPLTQLVGGIVFAVAYEKEKSLMVPIAIHTLGNLAIFSLMFIA